MNRLLRAAATAAVGALVAGVPGTASASCGSAACFLVTQSDQGTPAKGAFHVDLSFQYVDQTKMLEGSRSTSEVLVPKIDFEAKAIVPNHHREISTHNEKLQMALGYGVTSRVGIFGIVPLVVDKSHEHYDDVGTPDEKFVNTDGTRGFGDVAVGARYAFLVRSNDILLGSLTVKLPTGPYKLRDSEGAINEPTIQPGTGSYDETLAVDYTHHPFPRPIEWFVSGSYRFNGRNDLEYRRGDETIVSAGVNGATDKRWSWSVQLNARNAGRDDYLGMGVPSTGSKALVVTPGLRFQPGGSMQLYGYVQVPVYQKVNEAQLAPHAGFVLGVSRTF